MDVLLDIPVISSTCLYELFFNSSNACSICFLPYTLGLPSYRDKYDTHINVLGLQKENSFVYVKKG